MSFFARVLNHLVNEVLVNSLANNRTFQQLAVRSNAWVADIAKKSASKSFGIPMERHPRQLRLSPELRLFTEFSAVPHTVLHAAGAEHQKKIGQQAQDFQKTFRDEVSRPNFFAMLLELICGLVCALPFHTLIDSSGMQMKKGIDEQFKQK